MHKYSYGWTWKPMHYVRKKQQVSMTNQLLCQLHYGAPQTKQSSANPIALESTQKVNETCQGLDLTNSQESHIQLYTYRQ